MVAGGLPVHALRWVRNPLARNASPGGDLRPRDSNSVFSDGAESNPYMVPTDILSRTQISYPEYQKLARIASPARQSAAIRSEVVVRGPARRAETRVARFTDAAFFSMFRRPFAKGGPWTTDEDSGGTGVVVLGLATGRALFPHGDGVGQVVRVEGRPFRVVGVLAEYQPLNAPWQLLLTGGFEDALFLPIGEFQPLGGRPEEPIFRSAPRSPVGPPGTLGSLGTFGTLGTLDCPTGRGGKDAGGVA